MERIEVREEPEEYEYDAELEREWKEKRGRVYPLKKEWGEQYPELFLDKKDYKTARDQPEYHFGEYLLAVKYRHDGYQVLVEKYMFKEEHSKEHPGKARAHPMKWKIVRRIVKDEKKLAFIETWGKPGSLQGPDLFVYKDDGEYFFVEVKKRNDRLSEKQKPQHDQIRKELGCRVIVAKLVQTPRVPRAMNKRKRLIWNWQTHALEVM